MDFKLYVFDTPLFDATFSYIWPPPLLMLSLPDQRQGERLIKKKRILVSLSMPLQSLGCILETMGRIHPGGPKAVFIWRERLEPSEIVPPLPTERLVHRPLGGRTVTFRTIKFFAKGGNFYKFPIKYAWKWHESVYFFNPNGTFGDQISWKCYLTLRYKNKAPFFLNLFFFFLTPIHFYRPACPLPTTWSDCNSLVKGRRWTRGGGFIFEVLFNFREHMWLSLLPW